MHNSGEGIDSGLVTRTCYGLIFFSDFQKCQNTFHTASFIKRLDKWYNLIIVMIRLNTLVGMKLKGARCTKLHSVFLETH